jgi:hypothetical protein
MKKIISLILLGMVVSGNGYAGQFLFNKSLNDCLAVETNKCWVEDPTQSMGKRLDDKCVNTAYCGCYTKHTKDTVMQQRYCK